MCIFAIAACAVAWIEIAQTHMGMSITAIAACAVAWIEIACFGYNYIPINHRCLRGGVD